MAERGGASPSSARSCGVGVLAAGARAEAVLSVEAHRRAATGNTKSREVAGALAGTAPSSTARNSSTRRGLRRRRACHLTYT